MNITKYRQLKSNVALIFCVFMTLVGLFWIIFILANILIQGVRGINLDLFLKDPVPAGMEETGGLRNAFIGHLLITFFASLIGIPFGILGGIYVAEYGRNNSLAKIISTIADIMVSIPAIVVGIFVYALAVKPFGHFSGFAGSLTLAIIICPIVLRTTENMLLLIPWSLREAAFALGAPYYKVILQVVYRGAKSGILTGVLLSLARVTGEAAPLLFTSFNNNFFSTNMKKPMASLTVTIYQYATGPYETWHSQAWAGAFVITFFILMMNITARYFVRGRKK